MGSINKQGNWWHDNLCYGDFDASLKERKWGEESQQDNTRAKKEKGRPIMGQVWSKDREAFTSYLFTNLY